MLSAIAGSSTIPVSVLVADDSPSLRHLVAAHLVRLNGQVTEAADGVTAWALLATQEFDLAIIDLDMPNLDGVTVIQCIRGHPRTRHMPIIVVTSHVDRQTIEKTLSVGATAFIGKPICWSTFDQHIGSILKLSAASNRVRQALEVAGRVGRVNQSALAELCVNVREATACFNRRSSQIGSINAEMATRWVPLLDEVVIKLNAAVDAAQQATNRL